MPLLETQKLNKPTHNPHVLICLAAAASGEARLSSVRHDFAKAKTCQTAIARTPRPAGNATFLNAFFPHVKESITESLAELWSANKSKDYELMNIVAHRIKGTAMSSCFGILKELAESLENLEEYNEVNCTPLIQEIDEEIQILIGMI